MKLRRMTQLKLGTLDERNEFQFLLSFAEPPAQIEFALSEDHARAFALAIQKHIQNHKKAPRPRKKVHLRLVKLDE